MSVKLFNEACDRLKTLSVKALDDIIYVCSHSPNGMEYNIGKYVAENFQRLKPKYRDVDIEKMEHSDDDMVC